MKRSILLLIATLYCIMTLCNGQTCCISNSVKVQGMGEIRIRPNIAILYTSVTEDGTTIQNALYSINTSLNQITSSLQSVSVGANDISTSSISVYPKYNYTDGKSYLVGFTVYLSLTITIRGIENKSSKIGEVMDSLARDGAVTMSGITYDTQDPNSGKA